MTRFLCFNPQCFAGPGVMRVNELTLLLQRQDEDAGLVTSQRCQSSSPDEVEMAAPPGVISRVKTEVRRVHGEAQRWRGTVQEQRRHIYDRHTMLN